MINLRCLVEKGILTEEQYTIAVQLSSGNRRELFRLFYASLDNVVTLDGESVTLDGEEVTLN